MTPAGVVLDLDGVLLAAGAPIPGAADAVRSLQGAGHPCAVLTNMTSALPEDISERLAAAGIDLPAERIVTAAVATAEYLRRSRSSARVLLVAERGSERQFSGLQLDALTPRRRPARAAGRGAADRDAGQRVVARSRRRATRQRVLRHGAGACGGCPAESDRQAGVRDLPHGVPRTGPAAGRLRDGGRRPALGRAGCAAGWPARRARPHRQGAQLR